MSKYHSILGIPVTASPNQIKRAYHKLALKYHPDVNPSHDAEEKFKEIKRAYEFLITPQHSHLDYHKEELAKQQKEQLERAKREKLRKIKLRMEYLQQERDRAFKQSMKQATYSLCAIILVLFFWNKKDDWMTYFVLKKDYQLTTASISHVGFRTVQYTFMVNGDSYTSQKRVAKSQNVMLMDDGMPAIIGMEYNVKFNIDNPRYNKIHYVNISKKTLDTYLQMTAIKILHTQEFEFLNSEPQALVFLKKVYGTFGVDGISQIFFYDESFLENFSNNKISYYFFKKDKKYLNLIQSTPE